MSAGKYPRGLPPTYPQTYRRGSNTPNTNKAVNDTQLTPNRSRSLDGLLDSEPNQTVINENTSKDVSPKTQSCEDILNNQNNTETDDKSDLFNDKLDHLLETNATRDNILEISSNSDDKGSSTLSLHSSSSESKRKRNFMDRCVNKVRSLIKK